MMTSQLFAFTFHTISNAYFSLNYLQRPPNIAYSICTPVSPYICKKNIPKKFKTFGRKEDPTTHVLLETCTALAPSLWSRMGRFSQQ